MTGERWANATVAVTGGLGFVGSHFVEDLLGLGANVICLFRTPRPAVAAQLPNSERLTFQQVDLLDYARVQRAMLSTGLPPDAIVHCAALDGNVEFKLSQPAEIMDSNVRMWSNVLKSARQENVPDVIFLGSAEIYSPESEPACEEDDFQRSFQYSPNGYVLSKVFGEILAELYRKQFGIGVFTLRPANVYGPRDHFDGNNIRVIPAMLRKIMADEEIQIWGDGSQARSFVYVKDLVRAALRMAETGKYHTLNVATSEEVSILELARLLSAALRKPERVVLLPDKPAGAARRSLNVARLRDMLDPPPLSLEAGIAQTIDWFQSHEMNQSRPRNGDAP